MDSRQPSLSNRIRTLIAFRVLFVTALLGSFFFFHIGYNILPYPEAVSYVIVALYGLTIVYALLLGNVGDVPFAYTQIFLDLVAAMFLIAATGGIESWFSSLPLLITIAAAIVISRRAGFIIATASSIMYGSMIDLQYYKVLPIPYDPQHLEKDFFYNIFSHMVAVFLTAYLIGHLIQRLERKDIDLEDLSVFNRDVIENTPSGLFTTGLDGTVRIFNRAAEAITGIHRQSAMGRHLSESLPFVAKRGIECIERTEETLMIGDRVITIGLSMSRMSDAKGEPTGYIGVFEDLTGIKAMQEEIKKKEKLAARGELSASIAHEIRNPLAALKSSIEILKEGAMAPDKQQRLMGIALEEMDRLNATLTDFLNYSRPTPLDIRTFDVNQSLRNCLEMLRTTTEGRVSVSYSLDAPMRIEADEHKLQQVFWNIGLNACEAMPDGGNLTVASLCHASEIRITFSDTGKGISAEDRDRIFYPFFTTRTRGTGLGLSIAYRIVEDHGGRIVVRSKVGEGSVFTIVLPVKEGR